MHMMVDILNKNNGMFHRSMFIFGSFFLAFAPKRLPYDANDGGVVLRPVAPAQFFEVRTAWKITDLLMNPMV